MSELAPEEWGRVVLSGLGKDYSNKGAGQGQRQEAGDLPGT